MMLRRTQEFGCITSVAVIEGQLTITVAARTGRSIYPPEARAAHRKTSGISSSKSLPL